MKTKKLKCTTNFNAFYKMGNVLGDLIDHNVSHYLSVSDRWMEINGLSKIKKQKMFTV